jgi:hypothetical protein
MPTPLSHRTLRHVTALGLLNASFAITACDDAREVLAPTIGRNPAPRAAVAGAADATSLDVLSGHGQAGRVATTLPVPVRVRVADRSGAPVAGAVVTFAATADGRLEHHTDTTDASGVAEAGSWTLGEEAGTQRVTVEVPGTELIETVEAAAAPDAPAMLAFAVAPPDVIEFRRELAHAPELQVVDRFGNAVAHRTLVTVSTGTPLVRVLDGATAATDSTGRARFDALVLGAGTSSSPEGEAVPDTRLSFSASGLAPVRSDAIDLQCYGHVLPAGESLEDSWEEFDCVFDGGALDDSHGHTVVVRAPEVGEPRTTRYAVEMTASIAAGMAFLDPGVERDDEYVYVGFAPGVRAPVRVWANAAEFGVVPGAMAPGATGSYTLRVTPDSSGGGCAFGVILPSNGVELREQLRSNDCAERDGSRTDLYLIAVPPGAELRAAYGKGAGGMRVEMYALPTMDRTTPYETVLANAYRVNGTATVGTELVGISTADETVIVALRVNGRAGAPVDYAVHVTMKRASAETSTSADAAGPAARAPRERPMNGRVLTIGRGTR